MKKRIWIGVLVGVVALVGWIAALGGTPDDTGSAGPTRSASATPSPSRTPPPPSRKPSPTAPSPTPTPSPTASKSPDAGPAAAAYKQLVALRSVERQPSGLPEYKRAAYGTSWSDVDGNGCNQRDDVLLRDAVKGTVKTGQQGACDHDVLAGTWHDPYTGKVMVFTDLKDLHQAEAIQIDHVVPLSEAWRSGASGWSAERRKDFANDLHNLLAVDGPSNMSKSDDDPAAWRPRKAFQCTYALRWIATKSKWDLGADPSERAALEQMLAYCR